MSQLIIGQQTKVRRICVRDRALDGRLRCRLLVVQTHALLLVPLTVTLLPRRRWRRRLRAIRIPLARPTNSYNIFASKVSISGKGCHAQDEASLGNLDPGARLESARLISDERALSRALACCRRAGP